MNRADDLKDRDRLVLTLPLCVETTGLFGRTRVLNGQVKIEILVQERDGKFDLIVSDPVVSGV